MNINSYNRDVFVGEVAKSLTSEELISIFGFAYYENAHTDYFFTDDETIAFNLQRQKAEKNICTTTIETVTRTISAPADKEAAKDELKRIIQEKYPEEYFTFLGHFIAFAPNNDAVPLLERYLSKFAAEVQPDIDQANYNLVNFAYRAKHFNEDSYATFINKMIRISRATPGNATSKQFAGIGYIQADQSIAYYFNAYLPNVAKQKIQLEGSNRIVSPIFHKSYNPAAAAQCTVKTLKDSFRNTLSQIIDREYLTSIQAIKTLSPAISPHLFNGYLTKIIPRLTAHAVASIRSYAELWNIPLEK